MQYQPLHMHVSMCACVCVCVLQCDKSTALHFACTQGAIEAVQAMLLPYERTIDEIINIRDAANQTPLHRSVYNTADSQLAQFCTFCQIISENLMQKYSAYS